MKYFIPVLMTILIAPSAFANDFLEKLSKDHTLRKAGPTQKIVLNKSVGIESGGQYFHPIRRTNSGVGSSQNKSISYSSKLLKGMEVQASKGNISGKLTGVIIARLKQDTDHLAIASVSQKKVGQKFILVELAAEQDLLEALKRVKSLPQVESAEIEVNTSRLRPN